MADGNTSRIIVWVDDTVIVKKPLDGKALYYVADAVTGKPIAKANVEFFGWRQEQVKPQRRNNFRVDHEELRRVHRRRRPGRSSTPKRLPQNYQWLIIARTDDGPFAYLGFTDVWYGNCYDAEYNATKVFTITDRPVYRPEQTVKFKFWVRHAKYDQEDVSTFANQ